jgi:hypothetical protein
LALKGKIANFASLVRAGPGLRQARFVGRYFMNLYTPEVIRNIAADYHNLATRRCKELFLGDYLNDGALYLKINAPAMLMAFSLELSLKSILLFRSCIVPRTHSLIELYQALAEEDRIEINRRFLIVDVDEKLFPAFRLIQEQFVDKWTASASLSAKENEIIDGLKLYSKSFVDWRYVFEVSILDTEMLEFDFRFSYRLSFSLLEYAKALFEKQRPT